MSRYEHLADFDIGEWGWLVFMGFVGLVSVLGFLAVVGRGVEDGPTFGTLLMLVMTGGMGLFCIGMVYTMIFDPLPSAAAQIKIEAEAQERAAEQAQRAREQKQRDREKAKWLEKEAKWLEEEAEHQAWMQKLILDLETLQEYQPELAVLAHLEKYAVRHKDSLLNNRRAEIIQKNIYFRQQVLPMLKAEGREDLIPFGEWERKTLAIAERLDVDPPAQPSRQKPTTKQRRENMVEWERVKIDDDTAKAFVAFESVDSLLDAREAKIAEINERVDLDEDQKQERIHIIRTVADVRLAELQKGSSNGTPRETPPPVILGQS